ncbi:MAG: peptidoglycan-binding protein [Myxococcota bacterium]|nr:peptidoglycan-binding protein [Myxococcota bacterium]
MPQVNRSRNVHHRQPVANEVPPRQNSGRTYTVRSGDSLSAIAARHGCSLQSVLSANPQISNPNAIRPGQLIDLPCDSGNDRMANRWNDAGAEGARWRAFRGINAGRTLRRGHTGGDVRQLQEALVSTGHMSAAQARTGPGLFGPLTQAAVRSFQGAQGLTADGIVGPRTRAALGRALSQDSRPERSAPPVVVPPRSAPSRPSAHPAPTTSYDGSRPANGTTNTRAWIPVDAPVQSEVGSRSASRYDQVLNQFAVGSNPRYSPRGGNTYCNIFAWDVTRAMGAEIPHWVDQQGNQTRQGSPGAWEMNANATNRWLHNQGAAKGWRQVTGREAQSHANSGAPAVVSWKNPSGIGHIGMIRPGEFTARGAALAQAGRLNFNDRHVSDGFGRLRPEYWVHD